MTRFRTDAGERVVATRDEHGQLWVDVCCGDGETRRYGPLAREADGPGRARDSRGARPASAEAGGTLHARTAGQIARVLVTVDEQVDAGTLLLVMELMKMEVEIRAPRAGRVARVHVHPGDAVARGAELVTLAPSEPAAPTGPTGPTGPG